MSSDRKTQVLLLAVVGILAGVLSCTPAAKTTTPAKPAADGGPQQPTAAPASLTRDGIIKTAWTEARKHGYDPENADATFDTSNVTWKNREARSLALARSVGEPNLPPMFAGREYQVVYFHKRGALSGGLLYVFIDVNTGKVLGSVVGQ